MPNALEVALLRKIASGGPVPFSEFMGLALGDPEHGYYGSGRARIGVRGDFATSSALHGLFGRLIARWLAARWEDLGRPDPFDVFEYGPGTGRLAADVLEALPPEAFPALRYTLVETSPAMRSRQHELLGGETERVRWRQGAELPRGAAGVVLSNELVDALPVRRARVRGGRLEEAFVDASGPGHGLAFRWGEPSTPSVGEYVDAFCGGVSGLEGLEVEVGLDALAWLGEVSAVLGRGFVLTIDYGDVAERLVGPWAPKGTVRSFEGGRVSGEVLARPGERDLTASVNFTALMRRGADLGLGTVSFAPQRAFLVGLGLLDELAALAAAAGDGLAAMRDMLAAKALLAPGGVGDAMRVLVQRKEPGRPG